MRTTTGSFPIEFSGTRVKMPRLRQQATGVVGDGDTRRQELLIPGHEGSPNKRELPKALNTDRKSAPRSVIGSFMADRPGRGQTSGSGLGVLDRNAQWICRDKGSLNRQKVAQHFSKVLNTGSKTAPWFVGRSFMADRSAHGQASGLWARVGVLERNAQLISGHEGSSNKQEVAQGRSEVLNAGGKTAPQEVDPDNLFGNYLGRVHDLIAFVDQLEK